MSDAFHDGLPARLSGEWAREKLTYLGKYQQIFATGMRHKWPQRVYLDLMAGPGICELKTGERFAGSPILSLDADFTQRVFVERDSASATVLRQRTDAGALVIEGDCNSASVIDAVRASVPGNALGLAFLDNLGMDVPLATIARLTQDRKIDLVITFQLADFTRNIQDALSGKDDPTRLDAFFASHDWRVVARDAIRENAAPAEIAGALLEFYQACLTGVGYAHFAGGRRVMKNSRGAAQYRLLLAAKNPKAVEFFRKIEQIDPVGQRSLLD